MGPQQLEEKLIAFRQIFTLTVDRDLLYEPRGYLVFHTKRRQDLLCNSRRVELVSPSVARLSIVNYNAMPVHALSD